MATADDYARWIVENADKRGTPDFETVARAYELAKNDAAASARPTMAEQFKREAMRSVPASVLGGLVRGAGSIGATLATPIDMLLGNTSSIGNPERRSRMDEAFKELGFDTDSLAFGAGKLGGEVAGTAGIGSALALPIKAAGVAPKVVEALTTAGMRTGAAPSTVVGKAGDLALRSAAGGAVGMGAAGAVNPDDYKLGGAIGAALPPALKVAGAGGRLVGKAARAALPEASQEVAALAKRASELGIDIPADRLVNSRPLNAVSASLEYVPLSGRQATNERMLSQFNRALSRTFGQDSDNVTMALRKAQGVLGAKFDGFLKANSVKFDQQLLTDIADVANMARNELDDSAAAIIDKQISEIVRRGATGQIEGQAAYNIKKALDRIGNRKGNESYYARELKRKLMDALNRSVGPKQAEEFGLLRKQYGNMLDLEKMVTNNAEGGVSIGRIAGMKNIGNSDVQELADIAGQFIKTRENPHGALQRLMLGGVAATAAAPLGGLPYLAGTMIGGRATNAALNSNAARGFILGAPPRGLLNPQIEQAIYRSLPLLAADQ